MKEDVIIQPAQVRHSETGRMWYKFSRSKLSVIGLFIVVSVILLAIFAPFIVPYPLHAGAYTDFANANQAPSAEFLMGSDNIGRDILSRIVFGLRSAITMSLFVLAISVPFGVFMGLIAGYFQRSLIDSVITRITDIFLSVPPLVLALVIASLLEPSLRNAMLAITIMWWPWYTRLVYGQASSISRLDFVRASELSGVKWWNLLFKEILPNCVSPILTKVTLDMGLVIIIASSLAFVGLGEQPPAPALGNMVADGAKYMPEQWWMTIFPALAIMIVVLGFNLLGDGIRDLYSMEDK